METNLKSVRKLVSKFETEVLDNPEHEDLNITGVFIDKKEGKYRAIVLLDEQLDRQAIETLAAQYFENEPYKVVGIKDVPDLTVNYQTGAGIRHHNNSSRGTLGGVYTKDGDNFLYGLSNNHVIANLNNANVGDVIRDAQNREIGQLYRWIKLHPYPVANGIDAAIFRFRPDNRGKWVPFKPTGYANPVINLRVYKNGAASDVTYGWVKGYNGSVKINHNGVWYKFNGVISIRGVSADFNLPGDSGSVVLTYHGKKQVALIFGKSGPYCWALPIRRIGPLFS